MKHIALAASILAAALMWGANPPWAQNARPATSQEPHGETATTRGAAAPGGADHCERFTDTVEQIATYQQQITVTLNKLKQNSADLQNQNAGQAKVLLAEQNGLLDVMQSYVMQQGALTQSLSDQLRNLCPAPADPPKASPK